MKKYILSIDQGTTGSTVLVLDQGITVVGKANVEYPQIYPKPGWVEHNPDDIWKSVLAALVKSMDQANVRGEEIAAIGITNQRETTVMWEGKEAHPLHNAIVWQCRRTAPLCEAMKEKGLEPLYRKKTGLVLDAYFSGTKIAWLLENIPAIQRRVERGEAKFGTIDSYLVWKLTAGAEHVTDVSNASRTLLMDLKTLSWDDELLKPLHVPRSILPKICSSAEVYGTTKGVPGLPDGVPIAGIAGDQQAALFGQACFNAGEAKCTYGTGAFLLINTGREIVHSKNGMLTTVAWKIGGETHYALEGSTFIAGAAVQWLRDGLGLFRSSSEVEGLALQVEDTGGVSFVPALTGLGAPHWRPDARGIITGISRGTTKAHLARATLEGIALQIADLIGAMESDVGKPISQLRVDGGAAANNFLMQFESDVTDRLLVRPTVVETTGLGAAFLAGLATGFWPDKGVIQKSWREDRRFKPTMKHDVRRQKIGAWRAAVEKA